MERSPFLDEAERPPAALTAARAGTPPSGASTEAEAEQETLPIEEEFAHNPEGRGQATPESLRGMSIREAPYEDAGPVLEEDGFQPERAEELAVEGQPEEAHPEEGEVGVVPRPTLRQGSRGEAVRELQFRLLAIPGSPVVKPDGVFGTETRAAVEYFQETHLLPPDGVAGRRTWDVLIPLSGGPPLDDSQRTRLTETYARARERSRAGDQVGALRIVNMLYADPVMADKSERRAVTAFNIGTFHHRLRQFDLAIERYMETFGTPGVLDTLPLALERIREARLGIGPSTVDELRARRSEPVTRTVGLASVREAEGVEPEGASVLEASPDENPELLIENEEEILSWRFDYEAPDDPMEESEGLEEESEFEEPSALTHQTDDQAMQGARRLFKTAERLYRRGDYRRAIINLERVRHIRGLPARVYRDMLYNIGQANVKLERFATSIIYFENFLAGPSLSPEERTKAEERLSEAKRKLGISVAP